MKKTIKSILAVALAVLMLIPLATQASARQVILTQAVPPHQLGSTGIGRNAVVGSAVMGGVSYANALRFPVQASPLSTGSSFTLHNLRGQHATLSGYIGRIDGTGIRGGSIAFFGDGRLLQRVTINATALPRYIHVDVRGVNLLRIEATMNLPTDISAGIAGTTFAFAQGRLCNDMAAAEARFARGASSGGTTTPWLLIISSVTLIFSVVVFLILATIIGDRNVPEIVDVVGQALLLVGFASIVGVIAGIINWLG
ncbi:MAG: hypothetical protein FWD06_01110 [Oscillospiraceae bacterium]|nr:hypothetical protein [Oscillospiraceae bacterium]